MPLFFVTNVPLLEQNLKSSAFETDMPFTEQNSNILRSKQSCHFFKQNFNRGFERTYGWAWLMKLYSELLTWDNTNAKTWATNMKPLVELLSKRTIDFLDKLSTPLRPGTHANTAFSFSLMIYYYNITLKDFDDWVQERGLYFPNEWSENYETLITSNDKGEEPNDGGILISKIGKGHFIYTSYSWFRQLPAGVPGAYKLFSNLLSLGKK